MSQRNRNIQQSVVHDRSEGARAPHRQESVVTLSTAVEKQRLRADLLRLILKNEALRKRTPGQDHHQELIATDGSANSQAEAT